MNKLKYLNNLDDIRLTKEFIFLNPYKFIVFFIYLIIALLIGVSVLLAFTNKQETVDVQGTLQLSNKIQDIQVLVESVVETIHVQDGEYVEKGQNILSLRSDKLAVQKSNLEAQLATAKEQQGYLERLYNNFNDKTNTFQNNEAEGYFYAQVEKYLSQIRVLESGISSSELDSLNSQKKTLQELLDAMKNNGTLAADHSYQSKLALYNSKLSEYQKKIDEAQQLIDNDPNSVLLTEYEKQLNLLKTEKDSFIEQNQLEVQQQIDTLKVKIEQVQSVMAESKQKMTAEIENIKNSYIAEMRDKEKQLQNSIKEYENSIASINTDLSHYTIQASESGFVNYKSQIKQDTALKSGTIVGILTSTQDHTENFEVMLSVPSSGIGFIQTGQTIKLTVNGLDRKDYGFINGMITKIYETPIQVENSIYYQVTASIDFGTNNSIYKDLFALKDNMSVQANIITKETSWLTFILDKINIFKDDKETKPANI